MTERDVQLRLTLIRAKARDPESAHALEDDLAHMVLRAIAREQCEDPRALAAAALQSREIDFPRWVT